MTSTVSETSDGYTMVLDLGDADADASVQNDDCSAVVKTTATTTGEGLTSYDTTWDVRTYEMDTIFDYSATESCSGTYSYFHDGIGDRDCTWWAESETEVHNYLQEADPTNTQRELRLEYGDFYWNPGTPMWIVQAIFAPATRINHTVTGYGDSCNNLTVNATGVYGYVDLMDGQLTGPAPGALQYGVSKLEGSGGGGDYVDVPHTWSLTYYGNDQVSAPGAPTIGNASSGGTGSPINATARWSEPSNDGGSTITAYKVQAQKLNSSGGVVKRFNATRVASARQLTMVLPRGRYKFRVAAVNAKGTSAWSANSNIVRAR